jgi:hypothetical protein
MSRALAVEQRSVLDKGAKYRPKVTQNSIRKSHHAVGLTLTLKERNRVMRLKRMREEMLLALERDQLIEKELVIRQLSYLMIAMRQKILTIPSSTGNRFGDRDVPMCEVVAYLQKKVHEVLTELSRLPECAEPDWLERLEEK